MNQQKPQRLFLPRRLKHTGRIAAFFSFLFLNSGVNARLVAPIHICRYPERDLFLICVFPTSDVLSSSRRPSSLMNFFGLSLGLLKDFRQIKIEPWGVCC